MTLYLKNAKLQSPFIVYQEQDRGLHASELHYVDLLKTCAHYEDLQRTHRLHVILLADGLLQSDTFIGSSLIDTYARCRCMTRAQEVFDRLCIRNIVTWNALITGYVYQGDHEGALKCFENMHVSPDAVTFLCALKAIIAIDEIDKGQEIHMQITTHGLDSEPMIGSSLISMYSKSNMLGEAHAVFDRLSIRDTIVWNTLITGYARNLQGKKALECFELMRQRKVATDSYSIVGGLKACAILGAEAKGREIHMQAIQQGQERSLLIQNSLVDMYVKNGCLAEAEGIFSRLLVRDEVTWNVLIAGYVEFCFVDKALDCLGRMQKEGVSPDKVTYIFSMKACAITKCNEKTQVMHSEIIFRGFDADLLIGNTLVDAYSKCGSLMDACRTFDLLTTRTTVSWTALISGYIEHGHAEEAFICFEQMQLDGIAAVAGTFVCILKACTTQATMENGKEMHVHIVKKGLEQDIFIGNTLIDMYSKCGLHIEAQILFDKLEVQDKITWNALITGYGEHGCGREALDRFREMQCNGISPDHVTFICTLKACSSIAAISNGKGVHVLVVMRALETSTVIGNTLVDLYAKGGLFDDAQAVFDRLPGQSLASWNALILGYAQSGHMEKVHDTISVMVSEHIDPNWMTLISVLNACSHCGFVEEGKLYFHSMNRSYGIVPRLEHCVCLVDLIGRAGQIGEALTIIEGMPFSPSNVLWQIILGVCQSFAGCQELCAQAFGHAMKLDEYETGAYVCFSNMHVRADMQDYAYAG